MKGKQWTLNCFNDLLTQITNKRMFDMLEDDFDLGYVPSAPGNKSRAGSMKKLTKKDSKQPVQPQAVKPTASKSSEFDDLFEDLLSKEAGALGNPTEGKSKKDPPIAKKDSFDSYFQEPKPKSQQKSRLVLKEEAPVIAASKTPNFRGDHSDEIISQDVGFNKNLSKPAVNINAGKAEQEQDAPIFVSSRNMKPPLKKKESQLTISPPLIERNSPLSIPEEVNLTLSTNQNQEPIRPPPRSMNKRISVEGKSEKGDSQGLSLLEPDKKDTRKQEISPKNAGRGLFLTLDEPKRQNKQESKNIFSFSKQIKPQPSRQVSKQIKLFEKQRETRSLERPRQQLRLEPPRLALDMKIDQSMTYKQTPPPSYITVKPAAPSVDHERQMEEIKRTFQKQIDFLQQNLEKQISVNRETREKIIKDSNKMIEDERGRTKKIHEEELKRQQQMFDWERRRLEDNYQAEINELKRNLELANKNNQNPIGYRNQNAKADLEYLQMQLKTQKKIIEDRQKMIERRELELEEREQELSKRRKKEQQRLREEERKLLSLEAKIKQESLEEKKILAEQKQRMALELANLEIQAIRKQQKASFSLKENKLAKQVLENQRTELRLANAQLMSKYRAKAQEIDEQKDKVKLVEMQLLKKLRVVEIKSKEVSQVNKTMCQRKQNNWLDEKSISQGHFRPASVDKHQANQKSILSINQTKQRFLQLQNNTRDKLNISVKQNKRFDLDNYMLTLQKYNKMRANL